MVILTKIIFIDAPPRLRVDPYPRMYQFITRGNLFNISPWCTLGRKNTLGEEPHIYEFRRQARGSKAFLTQWTTDDRFDSENRVISS